MNAVWHFADASAHGEALVGDSTHSAGAGGVGEFTELAVGDLADPSGEVLVLGWEVDGGSSHGFVEVRGRWREGGAGEVYRRRRDVEAWVGSLCL